uniref:Uncharacterized protein n=1 Tax=Heterorhabditis bacteriophora TaxID=37862 RepID=A0A1I7WT27_HETBA
MLTTRANPQGRIHPKLTLTIAYLFVIAGHLFFLVLHYSLARQKMGSIYFPEIAESPVNPSCPFVIIVFFSLVVFSHLALQTTCAFYRDCIENSRVDSITPSK